MSNDATSESSRSDAPRPEELRPAAIAGRDSPHTVEGLLALTSVELGRANGELKALDPSRKGELVQSVQRVLELLATKLGLTVADITTLTGQEVESTLAHAPPPQAFRDLVGLEQEKAQILRLAPHDITVMIFGETGVGKTQTAAAIHALSGRRDGPFEVLDCTTLTDTLAQDELFGHARGAYTGAVSHKKGIIELAHNGTLFIDEIGDLPLDLQAKLLQVIQTGKFRALGNERWTQVNVRIIAATHRDLRQLVADGQFREDLYYRLRESEFMVRPLRERQDDIPLLAQHFLERHRSRFRGREHVRGFSPEALAYLRAQSWNGNARELENAIKGALTYEIPGNGLILPEHLGPVETGVSEQVHVEQPVSSLPAAPEEGASAEAKIFGLLLRVLSGDVPAQNELKAFIESARAQEGTGSSSSTMTAEFEKTYIRAVLVSCSWNVTEAAGLLGLERSHLYKKMRKYGIKRE